MVVIDVFIDLDEVDFYLIVDGLVLKIRFLDFYVWVVVIVGGFCFDVIGSATSDEIIVIVELFVDIDIDGV